MWESLTTKEYHKEAFWSHKAILYPPCGGNDINLCVKIHKKCRPKRVNFTVCKFLNNK